MATGSSRTVPFSKSSLSLRLLLLCTARPARCTLARGGLSAEGPIVCLLKRAERVRDAIVSHTASHLPASDGVKASGPPKLSSQAFRAAETGIAGPWLLPPLPLMRASSARSGAPCTQRRLHLAHQSSNVAVNMGSAQAAKRGKNGAGSGRASPALAASASTFAARPWRRSRASSCGCVVPGA